MAGPRFLYVPTVATGEDGGGEPVTGVTWRLVGGNNRELGRAAAALADLATCRAEVAELRAQAARLCPVLAMAGGMGMWAWRVALDKRLVAVAPRPYRRQREAQYNLGQFLAALPAAVLPEGVSVRPRLRDLHLGTRLRPAPGDGRAPRSLAVGEGR
ncbi:hypothetical protein ACFQLX_17210 [Streptomyces polyrhachis]|uniref:Uncharacterized protein n=1 Tax=Streptomyces polyrhachis TaxID=1282885 RepID=A0ABW2GIF1_9ACTN